MNNTWKTLESHDWWLFSLAAGACASRTPCKSSAIPPSASSPCVLPPFQVLHLLKIPVNYAQKCVRPLTSWNLILSSILHFIVHSIYIHYISFTFHLAGCMVWLYSTREHEGGTQTPMQSSSCVSGWLCVGGDGLGRGVQCFRFGCNHGISLGCLS